MINSAISNAFSGLWASQLRFDVSAHDVANINTPSFKDSRLLQAERALGGTEVVAIQKNSGQGPLEYIGLPHSFFPHPNSSVPEGFSEGSQVDLATEAVEQLRAQRSFELNLKTIQTSDQMTGTLIDLMS